MYECLAQADDEQSLIAYTAEPGSSTAELLAVLAGRAAAQNLGRRTDESATHRPASD